MRATIYHNPRCSTSRQALALLRESGAEVTVIDYLRTPPARETLAALLASGGIAPRHALRRDAPAVTDDAAALDLMARAPATLERPLVQTERGVRLARPAALVREIL